MGTARLSTTWRDPLRGPQGRRHISRCDHHVPVSRKLTAFLRGRRHSILLEVSLHKRLDRRKVAFRKVFETTPAIDKGFLGGREGLDHGSQVVIIVTELQFSDS